MPLVAAYNLYPAPSPERNNKRGVDVNRSVLALRLEGIISTIKEYNLHLSQGRGVKGTQISAEVNKGETRDELAKIAGVSHDTIDITSPVRPCNK